jgi:hypothetical protein
MLSCRFRVASSSWKSYQAIVSVEGMTPCRMNE